MVRFVCFAGVAFSNCDIDDFILGVLGGPDRGCACIGSRFHTSCCDPHVVPHDDEDRFLPFQLNYEFVCKCCNYTGVLEVRREKRRRRRFFPSQFRSFGFEKR